MVHNVLQANPNPVEHARFPMQLIFNGLELNDDSVCMYVYAVCVNIRFETCMYVCMYRHCWLTWECFQRSTITIIELCT